MRMISCNGCRVLRKGCGLTSCTIRPCLQWIKTPASQSNATLFLAKFYGRAGLLNLLIAAPDHLRPDVFKSLLYEACGRIVSPLYGSTGLLWSGNWQRCQNAVDAVLEGAPISLAVDALPVPSGCGFDTGWEDVDREKPGGLLRVRNRIRFKRTKAGGGVNRSASRASSSHHQAPAIDVAPENRTEFRSSKSIGIDQTEPEFRRASCDVEIELDLTLGLAPKVT